MLYNYLGDKMIDKLKKIIDESNNIVVFTGAGVGTESGLKDFRSSDGLYKEKLKHPPEYYLSSDCFYNDTKEFFNYYRKNMNFLDAKPNIVHEFIKELEDKGKLKALITQNIDGLDRKAGIKNVYEIHGTIYKNYCIKCNKEYGPQEIFNSKDIPHCKCGGLIKPMVTLYGESLPDSFDDAIYAVCNCDTLIVMGTSLTVNPASFLVNYFKGKNLVIINRDVTPYDNIADVVINDKLSDVIKKIR